MILIEEEKSLSLQGSFSTITTTTTTAQYEVTCPEKTVGPANIAPRKVQAATCDEYYRTHFQINVQSLVRSDMCSRGGVGETYKHPRGDQFPAADVDFGSRTGWIQQLCTHTRTMSNGVST